MFMERVVNEQTILSSLRPGCRRSIRNSSGWRGWYLNTAPLSGIDLVSILISRLGSDLICAVGFAHAFASESESDASSSLSRLGLLVSRLRLELVCRDFGL